MNCYMIFGLRIEIVHAKQAKETF